MSFKLTLSSRFISIFSASSYFALSLTSLSLLPTVNAKDGGPLRELIAAGNFNLDPVSLITLFFDEPEKDLLTISGDLTLLSGFGLFVNPTTLWNEYRKLNPGEGLEYYNPTAKIRSYIESHQVNKFIIALGEGHRNCGVIVDLYSLQGNRKRLWWPARFSWEWWILRPLMLAALIVIAGISEDFWGIGAIGALLAGQFIAIFKSILDATKLPSEGQDKSIQHNIFFLSNNVCMIIRCRGRLFAECSSHLTSRTANPGIWKILTTITFLTGVLFVGFTTLNFKIAYLSAHAIQAVLISFAANELSETLGERTIVNRTYWEQADDPNPPLLPRRREAYVWACEVTGAGTEWLKEWDLAAGGVLEYVKNKVGKSERKYIVPERLDSTGDREKEPVTQNTRAASPPSQFDSLRKPPVAQ